MSSCVGPMPPEVKMHPVGPMVVFIRLMEDMMVGSSSGMYSTLRRSTPRLHRSLASQGVLVSVTEPERISFPMTRRAALS